MTLLYVKSTHLFGLAQNSDRWAEGQRPVLVEGPGDALAVSLAGRAAAALCGTALSAAHLHALSQAVDPDRGLVIAFDGDPAGKAAVDRAWVHLAGHPGVRVTEFSDGRDPGSFADARDHAGLRQAFLTSRPLSQVVIDHRLERWSNVLDSIGGQVEAIRHVAGLLAPDSSTAEQGIAYLSRRLGGTVIDIRSVVLDEVARPHRGRSTLAGWPTAVRSTSLTNTGHHRRGETPLR